MYESIGKRIAHLRNGLGWTQQTLADRLAISRVAISHIEMDLTVPGERTITLLAGVFKMSPFELVAGTTYPQAKIDRLPTLTCCYTQRELDLALLQSDLQWLARFERQPERARFGQEIWERWHQCIDYWISECISEEEKEVLKAVRRALANCCHFT